MSDIYKDYRKDIVKEIVIVVSLVLHFNFFKSELYKIS